MSFKFGSFLLLLSFALPLQHGVIFKLAGFRDTGARFKHSSVDIVLDTKIFVHTRILYAIDMKIE